MKKLNFIFWGTPDVASETLGILKENGYLPSLIVTSPDARAGRKMIITPPPVKVWAEENKIPYVQPATNAELSIIFSSKEAKLAGNFPSDESVDAIGREENFQPAKHELFIVVAYGKIIPDNVLKMPKLGSVNIHYSLLPKYRGASPVESAILNGETETGVTIQQMKYEMDAGPILAQEKIPILPDETAPELRTRLIKIGGELLVKILPDLVEGKIQAVPQDEKEVTHCKKIKKEDAQVDPDDEPAEVLYNKFRAYAKWPRIFFFKNGKRVIITKAKLEDKKFVIEKVIPENGKEIEYKN